jgi:predicted HTH transcriptional regulator
MKRKQLLALIEAGENLRIEFKLKFSSHEKIAKELIAFANTKGGVIIFGVDDDKKIIGLDSEKETIELLKDTSTNYCVPKIELTFLSFEFESKEIVVASVNESDTKPHRLQDYKNEIDVNTAEVYVRVNDKSIRASKEMVRIFKAGSSKANLKKYNIGSFEKAVFQYLETNERITVELLCRVLNISERRASRTLVKMVRAGLLFFHNQESGEDFFTGTG